MKKILFTTLLLALAFTPSIQSRTQEILDEGKPDSYIGVPIGKEVYDHYSRLDRNFYYDVGDAMSQYWYLSANESYVWLFRDSQVFFEAVSASTHGIPMVIRDQRGAFQLPGEMTINAYFGLFSALPEATYPLFVHARAILKVIADGKLQKDSNKPNVVVAKINLDDGEVSFTPSEYMKFGYGFPDERLYDPFVDYQENRVKRWQTEEKRLMRLYSEHIPFSAVKSTFINKMVEAINATKEGNWELAVQNSYLMDVLVKDFMEHPDKVEDEDYTFAVQNYEKMAANNFPKWRAERDRVWNEFYT